MKHTLLLSAALALLLPAALPAHAQDGGVDSRKANTRAAHREAQAKQKAATNEAPLYPNATRTSPEQKGDKSLQKAMDALRALQEEDNAEDKMIAAADAIIANPKASAYDKSSAAYIAGNAWRSKDADSYVNAIKYYKMAIDFNGLHNNNHYNAMFGVAQMLDADGKQAEALQMIDRFISETKSEDAKALGVKAQILNGMNKPAEAAALLEKQLAANPNDKKTLMNMAALYQQADQDAKAAAIFDKMRAQGMLTESKDYEAGVSLLAHIEGRQKEALALMDEGLKKGILQPSYNTYLMQGQAYFEADDIPKAIDAWSKGAPLAKDGEMWLNVAKLNNDQEKWAAAKEAAVKAKAKGVKRQGDVYQAIALAENGLGNKAAAKAAVQESAKFAETKNWAEAQLRQGFAK